MKRERWNEQGLPWQRPTSQYYRLFSLFIPYSLNDCLPFLYSPAPLVYNQLANQPTNTISFCRSTVAARAPDAAQTVQADSQSLVPKFPETKTSILYVYIWLNIHIYSPTFLSIPLLYSNVPGFRSLSDCFSLSSSFFYFPFSHFLYLFFIIFFLFLLILFSLAFYPLADVVFI